MDVEIDRGDNLEDRGLTPPVPVERALRTLACDISLFFGSGMRIVEMLRYAAEGQTSADMRAMLADVAERIKNDQTLSEAFEAHESVVGREFINFVRVGEKGGRLAEMMHSFEVLQEIREKCAEQGSDPVQGETVAAVYALGELLGAGVPILEALELTGTTVGDETVREALGVLRADISAGLSIADSMVKNPQVFDYRLRALAAFGENTGTLDENLKRYARLHLDA